jgi:hypothetical protein
MSESEIRELLINFNDAIKEYKLDNYRINKPKKLLRSLRCSLIYTCIELMKEKLNTFMCAYSINTTKIYIYTDDNFETFWVINEEEDGYYVTPVDF